jgi:glyceraldehyde-3-phosphate dehydrogenase type I
MVIDATGVFKDKESLSRHIKSTVKKVIMCAPGKGLDGTFVMGVNDHDYQNEKHHIISNASCTTNCLAPIAKVLHENFIIERGMMTTVHSYTLDQCILDSSHKDPRRARAGAISIIPTSTGAAKAIGLVIKDLAGKLDGFSLRVPTPNVSLVDFTSIVTKKTSIQEVNRVLKEASEGPLKGILAYTEEELVSRDYMGDPHSSIVDSKLTNAIGQMIKVVSWYDNEFGFSHRVIDLAAMVGAKL